jgi:predicted esterase
MLIRVGDGTLDEIISYNELSHIIEQQQDQQEKGTKNVCTGSHSVPNWVHVSVKNKLFRKNLLFR